MALDATDGGATANSFCTVAEADSFLSDRHDTELWETFGDQTKEELLITATDIMESLEWLGSAETTTQALQLPRNGTYTKNGGIIDGIPAAVKNAQAMLAFAIATNKHTDEDANFSHLNLDGIVIDTIMKNNLPKNVRRLISHLHIDRSFTARLCRT